MCKGPVAGVFLGSGNIQCRYVFGRVSRGEEGGDESLEVMGVQITELASCRENSGAFNNRMFSSLLDLKIVCNGCKLQIGLSLLLYLVLGLRLKSQMLPKRFFQVKYQNARGQPNNPHTVQVSCLLTSWSVTSTAQSNHMAKPKICGQECTCSPQWRGKGVKD